MNVEKAFEEDAKLVAVLAESDGVYFRISPVPGLNGARLFHVEPWSPRLKRRRQNQSSRNVDRVPATWVVRERIHQFPDAAALWAQLDAHERDVLKHERFVPLNTRESNTCYTLRDLGLFLLTDESRGRFVRTSLGTQVLALRVGERVLARNGDIGTISGIDDVGQALVQWDNSGPQIYPVALLRRPVALDDPEASALLRKLSIGARKALYGKLRQPTQKITSEVLALKIMKIESCALVLTTLGTRVRDQDSRERAAKVGRR